MTNRQHFLIHQAQTTHFPLLLEFKRAQGCYLYDTNDKRYLDLISGISVSSLGHGNNHVKEAIIQQVNSHMHLMVYGEFVQAPQAKLAAKLATWLPEQLNCTYFVNSGAEATDGALKLAKRVTGRSKIVACKKAYHGSTHAALSLNSEEYYKQKFRPLLPDIFFATFNDIESLNSIDEHTACFILEVIASEQGYIPATQTFIETARKKCSEMGALLIIDEIQTGMGRTGNRFAFEHYSIVPDVLLLGKALGAGMPIGAFISSHELMQQLADKPMLGHITTFGGHPVVCAAALAGMEELENNSWIQDVPAKSNRFIQQLTQNHNLKICGKGLMLSIDFTDFETNKRIIDGCIQDGLITDWFLFAQEKMRITPPLTITHEQLDEAVEIILKNVKKIEN